MTLTYKLNGKIITLEELVNKYPNIWKKLLKQEIKFWNKISFDDIIIETTDEFEEALICEKYVDLEFIENTDIYYDYEVLVGQFL